MVGWDGRWARAWALGLSAVSALLLGGACGESSGDDDGATGGRGNAGAPQAGTPASSGGTSSGGTSGGGTSSGGGPGGESGETGNSGDAGDGGGAVTEATGGRGNGESGAAGAAGSPPAPSGSAPLRDACREYVRTYCERSVTCYGSSPRNIESCYETSAPACPDLLAGPGSTRTAESLLGCLDDLAAIPCEDWVQGVLPECATPGTRAAGEPCLYPAQCESLVCNNRDSECGHCSKLVEPGGACDDIESICPPQTICSSDTPRTCVPQSPPTIAPPRVEQTPLALGEACTLSGSCVAGAYCLRPDPAVEGTCTALPAASEACASELQGRRCAAGTFCNASERCEPLPGAGMPCATDPYAPPCNEASHCVRLGTEAGNCTARAKAGEPCPLDVLFADDSVTCEAGLVCRCADAACATGACVPLRREGEPCDGSDVCEGGSACEGGVCRPSDALTRQAVCDARR